MNQFFMKRFFYEPIFYEPIFVTELIYRNYDEAKFKNFKSKNLQRLNKNGSKIGSKKVHLVFNQKHPKFNCFSNEIKKYFQKNYGLLKNLTKISQNKFGH